MRDFTVLDPGTVFDQKVDLTAQNALGNRTVGDKGYFYFPSSEI